MASQVQHERWYFPEGDVVLSAPGADGQAILFRVHRTVLSCQSAIFSDMFSLPLNVDVNEQHDGAPKVHMTDEADDLAKFIGVMYEPASLGLQRYDPDTPLKVRGVLSLARKYQADAVRTWIVKHIEDDWPHTAEQWTEFQARFNNRVCMSLLNLASRREGRAEITFPEPAAAIRLAFDFDILSILPAAFYRLATTSVRANWPGEAADPELPDLLGRHELSARWNMLTLDDWRRVSHGKEVLATSLAEAASVYTDDQDSFVCFSVSSGDGVCATARRRRQREIPDGLKAKETQEHDVLDRLVRMALVEKDTMNAEYCEECRLNIVGRIVDRIDDVWEDLPNTFLLK